MPTKKNQRFRVAVTDFLTAGELDWERQVLGDIAEVEALGASDERELVDRIEEADAIIVFHSIRLTSHTISRLGRCKVIVRCGVGVDNIDLEAARARGIPVANVPDYGTEEVADSAIGMTLAMTRGISRLNSCLRARRGLWTPTVAAPLHRLRGQVFGIVGLGRIGSATALRAKALGMEVAFYDPYREDGYDKALGVRRAETLDELARQSYVVSMHCPLTDETHHMINRKLLAQLRAGSYLVNTARGNVVDTVAVLEAIESGQLAGAAIDVLAQEPPADDDPLVVAWRDPAHPAHDRVLITPHIAFYCEQGFEDMRRKAAGTCRRALVGEPIRNVVN